MIRKVNVRSVDGHKYRDIERLTPTGYGDEVWDFVCEEVLTPNCGWKDCFAWCNNLCDGCYIAEEWKECIEK